MWRRKLTEPMVSKTGPVAGSVPDRLHDVRSAVFFDDSSELHLANMTVNGSHHVTFDAHGGAMTITCRECPYEWRG